MNPDIYIDIHTHTYYKAADTQILLNVFPSERDKLSLPVYQSVGLHPWHIKSETRENDLKAVSGAIKSDNVIAVGETGLDKSIKTEFAVQEEVFRLQLNMAADHNKPVVIHCVRSYSEMLSYRKKFNLKIPWIFHWYNADEQIAGELIRKNCYLSFGHMLFKETSKAFRVFRVVPADRIFFETDDAGFTIGEVYEKAAFLRKCHISDLKKQIMDNFARCFEI